MNFFYICKYFVLFCNFWKHPLKYYVNHLKIINNIIGRHFHIKIMQNKHSYLNIFEHSYKLFIQNKYDNKMTDIYISN